MGFPEENFVAVRSTLCEVTSLFSYAVKLCCEAMPHQIPATGYSPKAMAASEIFRGLNSRLYKCREGKVILIYNVWAQVAKRFCRTELT